jgi:hypothetical protein
MSEAEFQDCEKTKDDDTGREWVECGISLDEINQLQAVNPLSDPPNNNNVCFKRSKLQRWLAMNPDKPTNPAIGRNAKIDKNWVKKWYPLGLNANYDDMTGGKRKTKRKTRKATKNRRSRKRAGADTPDSSYDEGRTDMESISVDQNEPFHADIEPIALANEVHVLEMGLLDDSFASEEPDESIGSFGTIGDSYEYDTSNGSIGSIGSIGDSYEYDTSNGSIGSIGLDDDNDDDTPDPDASLSLGGRNRRRRIK